MAPSQRWALLPSSARCLQEGLPEALHPQTHKFWGSLGAATPSRHPGLPLPKPFFALGVDLHSSGLGNG